MRIGMGAWAGALTLPPYTAADLAFAEPCVNARICGSTPTDFAVPTVLESRSVRRVTIPARGGNSFRDAPRSFPIMAYQDPKEFAGKPYHGMTVGGSHRW